SSSSCIDSSLRSRSSTNRSCSGRGLSSASLNKDAAFSKHLRRILICYFRYYHKARTHLSLEKDPPEPREIQPPNLGPVVAVPEVGGLHHRYDRRAAWLS
ncbi:MAG: hypothetical protein ABSC57_03635, partial [Syntrophales bacterium]